MANSVDLDEVAHYEPPHQDLRCLPIQPFSSLVLKELRTQSCSQTESKLILLPDTALMFLYYKLL